MKKMKPQQIGFELYFTRGTLILGSLTNDTIAIFLTHSSHLLKKKRVPKDPLNIAVKEIHKPANGQSLEGELSLVRPKHESLRLFLY